MYLDDLVETIRPVLKERGYKKKKYCWYKNNEDITVIFAIQRSQYGADMWYYNFGVVINQLESKSVTSISGCHITERLDMKINGEMLATDILLKAIIRWEEKYGNMESLRRKALENNLPRMTTVRARTYLTTVC